MPLKSGATLFRDDKNKRQLAVVLKGCNGS